MRKKIMETLTADISPKLYVWDSAVFVLANSLPEARVIASERVKNFSSLLSAVWNESPRVLSSPDAHIVFHSKRDDGSIRHHVLLEKDHPLDDPSLGDKLRQG
jgi:hypothetical protein